MWSYAGGGIDFSTESLYITFPADEGDSAVQSQFALNISIANDDIDEADREYFILYLQLSNEASTYPGLTLIRTVSVGVIDDDEGRSCTTNVHSETNIYYLMTISVYVKINSSHVFIVTSVFL